jgi:hypothetical protein
LVTSTQIDETNIPHKLYRNFLANTSFTKRNMVMLPVEFMSGLCEVKELRFEMGTASRWNLQISRKASLEEGTDANFEAE